MGFQEMQSMVLAHGNGQIWCGALPTSNTGLTIYFCILPLCGPANACPRKAFVLILTLGKMIECF